MTGASGFIGKPLLLSLRAQGHEVVRLIRTPHPASPDSIVWDPDQGKIARGELEGFDAVINLAGENIASGRWTKSKRKKILFSRTVTTFALSHALSQIYQPPKTFISVSAVGYYGNRGDEELTEESPPGENFLSLVCKEWEQAASPLRDRGCRTIHPRFGVVLSKDGGMLKKILRPFRWGLGGKLGTGQQWISWIARDDLIRGIIFVLENESLEGPVNFTSPEAVRQEAFAQELGHVLHRPASLSQPAWLLKLLFGQMADETLLSSARAYPAKLTRAGFSFLMPTLDSALHSLLE